VKNFLDSVEDQFDRVFFDLPRGISRLQSFPELSLRTEKPFRQSIYDDNESGVGILRIYCDFHSSGMNVKGLSPFLQSKKNISTNARHPCLAPFLYRNPFNIFLQYNVSFSYLL
jgi:hypothetical protein